MKKGRSTKTPTPEEAERLREIGELGCIACRLWGMTHHVDQCERDHLNVGGLAGMKRRGHMYTIGLCPWHHRGETFKGKNVEECRLELGPSEHHHKVEFLKVFGSFDELLETQNLMLEQYRNSVRMPWDLPQEADTDA